MSKKSTPKTSKPVDPHIVENQEIVWNSPQYKYLFKSAQLDLFLFDALSNRLYFELQYSRNPREKALKLKEIERVKRSFPLLRFEGRQGFIRIRYIFDTVCKMLHGKREE